MINRKELLGCAEITAAPNQSKLSRISYKRVSQRGLLGERAFEQVQEIFLEREELGILGKGDENGSEVQEPLHSLQETGLAQTERVCPTASGEGLVKEVLNTQMRGADATGRTRAPCGYRQLPTLSRPDSCPCVRCQGGLGSFLQIKILPPSGSSVRSKIKIFLHSHILPTQWTSPKCVTWGSVC